MHLAIFGSVARGDARAGSDIDVMIEEGPKFTLFDLVAVGDILELAAGRRVDVVMRRTMTTSTFAGWIEAEAVDVFLTTGHPEHDYSAR